MVCLVMDLPLSEQGPAIDALLLYDYQAEGIIEGAVIGSEREGRFSTSASLQVLPSLAETG